MPVYVKAENAFDPEKASHISALDEYEKVNRYTYKTICDLVGGIESGQWEAIENRRAHADIKALDHDGFQVFENGVQNLAVFNSTQVKSAIGNNGNFDATNIDIRMSCKPVDQSVIDGFIDKINGVRQAAGEARISVVTAPTELPVKILEQAELEQIPLNEIHGVLYKYHDYIVRLSVDQSEVAPLGDQHVR